MTWLEIRPQDVWLFRDGKPFSAGDDHSARSMFPPTPLTVQGALRQKISVSLGVSLREYKTASTSAGKAIEYIGKHGELHELGKFRMQGPYISLQTDEEVVPLLPVPADLLVHENDNKIIDDVFVSSPDETDISSDLSGYQFLKVQKDFENLPAYWMSGRVLQNYLNNEAIDPSWFVPKSENTYADARTAYQHGKHAFRGNLIYSTENRFGVSTNALTSFREEGQLYQVQFIRPAPGVGLLVSVSDDIPANLLEGNISLGGEQRQASATVVQVDIPSHPKSVTGRFKVIFLTPAYFNEGWEPKNGDWSKVFGYPVKLKSAALYRPLKIGGWNSAANRARTMHNYVAPGSVYYFETNESFQLPEAITEDPDGINAKALGFGQYVIGQW